MAEDKQKRKAAEEAIRKNQTKINKSIQDCLVEVLDACETDGLITEEVKGKLKSDWTGKSEFDRASKLIDTIRKSCFIYDTDDMMERFLTILEENCGRAGKGVSKEIRENYPYLSQQSPKSNGSQKPETRGPSGSFNCQPPNPVDDVVEDWGGLGGKKESPVFTYPRAKGMVAIIGNEKWIGNPSANRDGTDTDMKKIKETFEKLGYTILPVKKDLKAAEINDCFEKFTKGFDSGMVESPDIFVCFILSHGNKEGIEGVDGEHVQLKELAKHLESDKCPALKGKPKLFFIQACRGRGQPDDIKLDHTHPPRDEDKIVMDGKISAIPPGADFFFGYSTVSDNVSLRRQVSGSFYIHILCDTIDRYYKKLSLNDIIMMVHQQLATDDKYKYENDGRTYRQMAEMVTTLRGNVFFHK